MKKAKRKQNKSKHRPGAVKKSKKLLATERTEQVGLVKPPSALDRFLGKYRG